MEKLLKAKKSLAQNSKKGFTLVELIIVIVIIAILIAALLPAVLGAIDRANRTADAADARTVLTAASIYALDLKDAGITITSDTPYSTAGLPAIGTTSAFDIILSYIPAAGAYMQAGNFSEWIFRDGMPVSVTITARAGEAIVVP